MHQIFYFYTLNICINQPIESELDELNVKTHSLINTGSTSLDK